MLKIPLSFHTYFDRKYWWIWFAVCIIALCIQLLTLDVLPHLQQDEAQITDYGRLALNPTSDWAITWWMREGKPLLLWSYLGPLLAEVSYQVTGASGLGPRIAGLLGGMFAGTMCLGWLLSKRVQGFAAFGLSLALMLDPLFVLSQRIGRVDSWVIGLCLACCWLLQVISEKKSTSINKGNMMAAGGVAAIATLVWPSAFFLYPLIILELVRIGKAKKAIASKSKFLAKKLFYFGLGGGIVTVLLLLPILENVLIIFGDMSSMVAQNVDTTKGGGSRLFALIDIQVWLKMIKAFVKTFTPILPILAILGVMVRRDKGGILVTIITISLIFTSLVYEFRVLYLLPYFVLLSSGLFIKGVESTSKKWINKTTKFGLGLLVVWSIGISLGVRTFLGWEAKTELNRNRLAKLATSSIGAGNYKVFLGFTYELYFVGRSLGWKLYTPTIQFSYDEQGNWIRHNDYEPKDKFLQLLSEMDYAIFPVGSVNSELEKQLKISGLGLCGNISSSIDNQFKGDEVSENRDNKEIFLWFLQGKTSYGSYVLYKRDNCPD
ncbi:hypothetical protein L1I30_10845 [Gillisia sp. M10.2A]|uniref:Glycosyltransferase RgtA/B/C/D-like domain-containing protein n=1 Tax=Gillisia lutea TaxID=2909668 RepID=A0ABS9EL32_9FLAO|nr:hypothetical protein [Gillisia lutea]MCF4102166.1 hypothetical protein [Gillisia lutea]